VVQDPVEDTDQDIDPRTAADRDILLNRSAARGAYTPEVRPMTTVFIYFAPPYCVNWIEPATTS